MYYAKRCTEGEAGQFVEMSLKEKLPPINLKIIKVGENPVQINVQKLQSLIHRQSH